MARMDETAAVVALMRRAPGSRAELAQTVERAGSAVEVLERDRGGARASPPRLFDELGAPTAETELQRARADLRRWQAEEIGVITVLDDDYPSNLRAAADHPPLIFVAGRLHAGDERSASVIGSRSASPEGLETAGVISTCLAALDYTVFSGLAAGIDTAAHFAALARGARTIAVLGTGVQRSYPRENVRLQTDLARRGAVVSQFWPDAAPTPESFRLRNALMSGLTRASVIVEASHMSGVRVQARASLTQHRPVVLLASLLVQPWAQQLASRDGVHVVESHSELKRFFERLPPVTC